MKKIDGSEYPPNNLREIMIQIHLNENGVYWKLLDGDKFKELCNVVDNTMKERHKMGLGVHRSCDIITHNDEDKLFTDGILGEDTPAKLLTTVIYMIGLYCALRGGVEHNKLHRPGCNCQFRFECDNCGIERLVYVEAPLQKTNQGGLLSKNSNKTVYVYPSSDIRRCPVYYLRNMLVCYPKVKDVRSCTLGQGSSLVPKFGFVINLMGSIKSRKLSKKYANQVVLKGSTRTIHYVHLVLVECMKSLKK